MKKENVLCEACHKAFIGLVVLDENFKILELNEEIGKRGGIDISKFIGTNFLSHIVPEEREKVEGMLKKVMDKKEEGSIITKILRPDGPSLWVTLIARTLGNHLLVNIIDVSDMLQMEKTLEEKLSMWRVLEESIQDGIIVIDEEGNILSWNSAAERIFGYRRDEVVGKKIWDTIIPDRFAEEYKNGFEKFLKNGKGLIIGKPVNMPGKRKDGIEISLEMSIGTVKINDKWRAVAVIRDITERVEKELELEKEKDELAFLYKFLNKISGTLDPDKMFQMAYEELSKLLEDMDAFIVALVNEKNKKIDVEFVIGNGKRFKKHSIELNDRDTLTGWVAVHGKELYVRNVQKEKLPSGIKVIGYPMLSWAGFPLKYRDRVLGVLSVQSKMENAFSERDLRILRLLADNFAMVLANAEMYKELKLREEMYRSIVTASIVGVATTDLDMRFTYVNEYFAELLGYRKDEMIGRYLGEFTTEKGLKDMLEGTKRRRKGISDSYESEFLTKSGKIIPVLIYASPIKNYKGEIIGTVGVIIDISNIKEMEEELKVERKKYKMLFENVATGIAIIQDELVVYVNEEMARMLGYSRNEIIGANIVNFIHPHALKTVVEYYKARLSDLPVPRNYISRLLSKNGSTVWCEIKASKIEWEGRPAVMASITDITHLKETEETLIALEKISEKIKRAKSEEEIFKIVTDGIKSIMHISNVSILKVEGDKIVMRFFEWKKNKKPPFIQLDLNSEKSIVAWVARNGKSYYTGNTEEDPLYLKAHFAMLSEYATPIIVNGKVYGVLDVQSSEEDGISQEERMMLDMLAAQVGATIESLKYQKELEASRNLQELMLHIVSHDLKNPLAVISGYIELLKEEYNPEFLEEMQNALERASKIIERARLFSKLDMKKIKQEKKEMHLRDIIERAYELIKEKYPEGRVEVEGDARISLYPIIEEVFVNLLDNAFKYGANEVRIKIEKGENVRIEVVDNGSGIPDKQKEIIFEAFEKLSKKGSGLGLAIVKKVVELHNGEIWVEDNEPKGSKFIIVLPYQK